MANPTLTIVCGVVMVACSIWSLVQIRQWHQAMPLLRSAALDAFRQTTIRSDLAALAFDGARSEIILQQETGGPGGSQSKHPPYTLTVYARSEHGQYFLFVYSPPDRFIKHLRPEIARVVLKDRYRDPPTDPNSTEAIRGR